MKHGVYRLNCLLCEGSQDFYEGETDRPAYNRFMEHTRAGNNPASYSSNGIGKHYAMFVDQCITSRCSVGLYFVCVLCISS